MSTTISQTQRTYPRTILLDNGNEVSVRLMTPADADRIVSFARNIPPDDLLFLRTDITRPEVVAQWVQHLESGSTVTVIAEVRGEMEGYASLHLNDVSWQRHLGEIRIQVGSRYRSQGLGKALAGEIFSVARDHRLHKIVAHMTPEQKSAIAMVERLGFRAEALLQDFVIDRAGRTRDMLVMAYDVMGLNEHLN